MGRAPTIGSQPSGNVVASPPASVIANRYTVLGLLGAGGMGRVYRAHDRSLDEVVALKLLRRELLDVAGSLDRFRQEVKLARKVTSPHVVRTFDLGEHGDDHFLTMEYIDGRSLARWLDEELLPLDGVLRVARAVCAGITAAHAAGVLHRDLKPDNVLVAKDGRIAITDFGLARADVAAAEGFVGTPAYMAPEQVTGGAPVGPAADVYALGAIVFEMVTGVRPFTGRDPLEVARARLERPPPDPRTFCAMPDAVAELVLRCLARDPAARFADGAALGVALAALADVRATAAAARRRLDVPVPSAHGVALQPLVADGDLAELAAGLSEEIADALSMTRSLRVAPLASVRRLAGMELRALGKQLDVDVVVEGSLRRRGDGVRLTARVLGAVDGFQLWASHFDTAPEGLLSMSDDVARAIARALTTEIHLPPRPTPRARAIELYLEGKAKLRQHWFDQRMIEAPNEDLGLAAELAPDDSGILANLSIAIARRSFLHADGTPLGRALEIAERAIAAGPDAADAWLALGLARLYNGEAPAAGFAFSRALARAPGAAPVQRLFGSVLLEAGALSDAIAHLEAAVAIDPVQGAIADLPRAYVFTGRWDDAFAALAATTPENAMFAMSQAARFRMWRGERSPDLDFDAYLRQAMGEFGRLTAISQHVLRHGAFAPGDLERLVPMLDRVGNPRLRVTQIKTFAELLAFVGDHDTALTYVERAVDAGLQDHLWMMRCPIIAPLRERPRFHELAAVTAARGRAVLDAIESARA